MWTCGKYWDTCNSCRTMSDMPTHSSCYFSTLFISTVANWDLAFALLSNLFLCGSCMPVFLKLKTRNLCLQKCLCECDIQCVYYIQKSVYTAHWARESKLLK